MILFNAPAHNPTGFSPSLDDWDKIVDVMKKKAADKTKKIVFFVDIAYIDFAGDLESSRAFMPKLSGLPENILVVFGFSMSKSYTVYGMRSGAMICLTPNKAIADEFKMVNMFSNRGTWSNGTRPAMIALAKIFNDPALLAKVTAEREKFSAMLAERGAAFVEGAKESGIRICPYGSGFFITVFCENAEVVCQELQKEGIFTVPFGKGIRVAICAITAEASRKVALRMADAIRKVNG